MSPYISICIPAYKNVSFLKRLLDSISVQHFKDFEVIISDDSPNEEVKSLVDTYRGQLPLINYWKNSPAKGMPENWNSAMAKAEGQWIKIMHDDDWFAENDCLTIFAQMARKGSGKFIFSNYINKDLNNNTIENVTFPVFKLNKILKTPLLLMAGNIIGPPSVCMVHRSIIANYNPQMHWLVDIDYYIQIFLQQKEIKHIKEALICIGVNKEQITNSVKNNPAIEIGESKMLLDRYGVKWLKNIWVYDGWWRLFRNMNITNCDQLMEYEGQEWPPVLRHMIAHQKKCPASLLQIGFFSKFCMLLSYLSQFRKL